MSTANKTCSTTKTIKTESMQMEEIFNKFSHSKKRIIKIKKLILIIKCVKIKEFLI